MRRTNVSVPVPAWINPPGLAPPYMLRIPPPSIGPEMVVLPAPLMVMSLITVCSGPLTVKVFPLATVHVCGPPT